MMRNRTGQTITDYAGLLAEALPLLDLPTDPVTLGGWNGGDAEDGAAMILAMAHERRIRLSDAAMAEIEEEARLLLRDDSRPARALGANILGHIEAIRALDAAGADAEFEARAAAFADRLSPSAGRRRDPNLGREHTAPAGDGDWLRQSLTGVRHRPAPGHHLLHPPRPPRGPGRGRPAHLRVAAM